MSEDHSPHQLQAPVDGNLHVTLRERAPAAGSGAAVTAAVDRRSTPTLGTAPTELVLFAASSPRELLAKAELLDPGRPVAELARASQLRLKAGPAPAGPVRLAVTAADTAELIAKLDAAAGRITGNPRCGFSTPTGIHYATGTSRAGLLAFVFPG